MIRLTGEFALAAPPQQAFHYFTPLGEKEWAHGWDPRFPAADDEGDGTVFETGHGRHGPTTWVIVDMTPGQRIRYARVAHGLTAGTVDITLAERAGGASDVTVTYELTALTEQGAQHLHHFAESYVDYLKSWREAITSAL
ncbi:MAG TPA: SRPBCC family protein [Candidatus Limnocylindrales bacterium]|nr:SRPBCC family protein [Candidatus Limnocylindrales bacterium]